jgi:hypothetical protein
MAALEIGIGRNVRRSQSMMKDKFDAHLTSGNGKRRQDVALCSAKIQYGEISRGSRHHDGC